MKKELVNVSKSNKLTAPEVPGRHYRILCMTGADKGLSYFLKSKRVVMGRGDTADIKVQDQKSSREHAELVLSKDGYVVTDLGSQNGIIINDLKVLQHSLKENDKIIIGKTVFKYNVYNIEKPISSDVELKTVDSEPVAPVEKKTNLVRVALVVIAIVFVAVMMLDDGTEKPSPKKGASQKQEVTDNFTMLMKQKAEDEEADVREKVGASILRGQREFREGNYFRAIEEFNMALLLSPKHGNASYYLNKTRQALDNEIEVHFLKAKQQEESLKYSDAAVSYCSVIRLLNDYPEDKRYKDAEENIRKMEERLGREKGEISCF